MKNYILLLAYTLIYSFHLFSTSENSAIVLCNHYLSQHIMRDFTLKQILRYRLVNRACHTNVLAQLETLLIKPLREYAAIDESIWICQNALLSYDNTSNQHAFKNFKHLITELQRAAQRACIYKKISPTFVGVQLTLRSCRIQECAATIIAFEHTAHTIPLISLGKELYNHTGSLPASLLPSRMYAVWDTWFQDNAVIKAMARSDNALKILEEFIKCSQLTFIKKMFDACPGLLIDEIAIVCSKQAARIGDPYIFLFFFNLLDKLRVNPYERMPQKLLMIAACNGHTTIARMIMDRGCTLDNTLFHVIGDIDHQNSLSNNFHDHETNKNIIQGLLALGGDINARNHYGQTLLANAFQYADRHNLKTLIELGAHPNEQDAQGNTILSGIMLLDTILKGFKWTRFDETCLDMLFRAGADMKIPNNHGETPLMIAHRKGYANIVRALIQKTS